MKKLAAILLILLFLFNLIGYKLLTEYLESRADTDMQAKLDISDYNEDNLVTIKVATRLLPYIYNSDNFQSIDGTITIDGVDYNYVKVRYYNDTMELKCIPNEAKTGITNARDEFAKLANDFVNPGAKKTPGNSPSKNTAFKNSIGDYDDFSVCWSRQILLSSSSYSIPRHIHTLIQRAIAAPGQPPDC